MTVVEALLEMLHAHLPGFELDERWVRRRSPPRPGGVGRGGVERGGERTGAGARRGRPRGERGGSAVQRPQTALAGCYAELGVPPGADLRQVRRAWLRLVRRHHPDRCGADRERQRHGTELLKRFNHAYGEIRKQLQRQIS